MSLRLYHYWRSSASWRVRWALELKKVPHEKIAVDLLSGEEKKAPYLKTNPSGYVPCLEFDGRVISESMAILEWLEEKYPKPSFFVGDAYQRALIRRLAETVNSGIQPLQNLDVIRKISSEKTVQNDWVKHWITRGLGVYESILAASDRAGKKFSVSDHPTMADICLIPQCQAAQRFEVDLSQFPAIKAIYEYALSTPECASSAPERFQP
jgi:maleylacetoacetate isomerase